MCFFFFLITENLTFDFLLSQQQKCVFFRIFPDYSRLINSYHSIWCSPLMLFLSRFVFLYLRAFCFRNKFKAFRLNGSNSFSPRPRTALKKNCIRLRDQLHLMNKKYCLLKLIPPIIRNSQFYSKNYNLSLK